MLRRTALAAIAGSATFGFARRRRASGRGLLVGEPADGNLRGIDGRAFFFLRLPATGLAIDRPPIGQFPGGALPPDGGLAPDMWPAPTIPDVVAGHDPLPQVAQALAARA